MLISLVEFAVLVVSLTIALSLLGLLSSGPPASPTRRLKPARPGTASDSKFILTLLGLILLVLACGFLVG